MNMITVEVAYASLDKQFLLPVTLPQGSTIEAAIHASGLLALCQEIDLSVQKVGIFGERKQLSDGVKTGDRIEIYRLLQIDPKEVRRLKAKSKR